jgi:hypothetical protein
MGISGSSGNRHPACVDFVKLVLLGRRGKIGQNGEYYSILSPKFAEGFDEQWLDFYPNCPIDSLGAWLFVNSISEEKWWATTAVFNDRLNWALSHELGHLIVKGADDPPLNRDHIDAPNGIEGLPGFLMGLCEGLSSPQCKCHEKAIKHTNLPERASVDSTP